MHEIIINQIPLPFDVPKEEAISKAEKAVKSAGLKCLSAVVCRCSVDARRKNRIRFVWSVMCRVEGKINDDKLKKLGASLCPKAFDPLDGMKTAGDDIGEDKRPVVVGFGPAGMFAAHTLALAGYRPIVLERGGSIDERCAIVDGFMKGGRLDTETNVQFGAGGAGTCGRGTGRVFTVLLAGRTAVSTRGVTDGVA